MTRPLAVEPFTLTRPFGLTDLPDDEPSGADTRPFGLRFVVDPPESATAVVDPTKLTYDQDR